MKIVHAGQREVLAALAPAFVLLPFAIAFDLAERLAPYTTGNRWAHFGDLLLSIKVAILAYLAMLVRRTLRLRRELRARELEEADVRRMAMEDPLTGLGNRRAFIAEIAARAGRVPAHGAISVLICDLDRFKPVNDTHGHEAGDRVLRTIADRIATLACGTAFAARMGGDEFACVLAHANDGTADAFADALAAAVAKPVQLAGGLVEVGSSIGLATARGGNTDPQELLRQADFAMYRAKRTPGIRWCRFEPEMSTEMRETAQIALDLRAGINRGEFVPHYQPIVNLATGEVSGFEALARWHHPVRGLIGPDQFIPVAEEIGLIQELGLGILRRACADAREWPPHLTLSVNISPLQLNDTWLPERIIQTLCQTGLAPGRLIVELTETRLFHNIDTARRALASLKNAGVKIALDDFGTGYASLKHLRELQFDRIKIDRNFIHDMDQAESGAIVRAILKLSSSLKLPVTAEGVDNARNAERLGQLGCTLAQGFLFSRAVTAGEALKMARGAGFGRDGKLSPDLRACA